MNKSMIVAGIFLLAASACLAHPGFAQQSFSPDSVTPAMPFSTVIPVMLTSTLNSAKAVSGESVTGKVMEAIPLPSGGRIPKGAKVLGHVSQVQVGDANLPSLLVMQFDAVSFHGRELPMKATLRALASMMAVMDAQVPLFEPDTTPRSAILLAPVGGEASFQPDNPETSRGKLVFFSGIPATGCGTRVDEDGPVPVLWVFSPYACGAYGFGRSLAIVKDGSEDPAGNIILASRKTVSIHAGSGWLLRAQFPANSADQIHR